MAGFSSLPAASLGRSSSSTVHVRALASCHPQRPSLHWIRISRQFLHDSRWRLHRGDDGHDDGAVDDGGGGAGQHHLGHPGHRLRVVRGARGRQGGRARPRAHARPAGHVLVALGRQPRPRDRRDGGLPPGHDAAAVPQQAALRSSPAAATAAAAAEAAAAAGRRAHMSHPLRRHVAQL